MMASIDSVESSISRRESHCVFLAVTRSGRGAQGGNHSLGFAPASLCVIARRNDEAIQTDTSAENAYNSAFYPHGGLNPLPPLKGEIRHLLCWMRVPRCRRLRVLARNEGCGVGRCRFRSEVPFGNGGLDIIKGGGRSCQRVGDT